MRRHRLALALAIVLILACAGVAIGGFTWLSLTFSKANSRSGVEEARQALEETFSPTGSAGSDSASHSAADPPAATTVPFVPPENPDSVNILLLGADGRPDEGDTYGRSDTMMVVHIDPKAGFLSVMSLPRAPPLRRGLRDPDQTARRWFVHPGRRIEASTILRTDQHPASPDPSGRTAHGGHNDE